MSSINKFTEQLNELLGRLLNGELDATGRQQLNDLLAKDHSAQSEYVRCLDMEAAMRRQMRLLDDEDFALLEVQAALDTQPASEASASGTVDQGDRSTPAAMQIQKLFGRAGNSPKQWLKLLQHHGGTSPRIVSAVVAAMLLVSTIIVLLDWADDGKQAPTGATASTSPESPAEVATANLTGAVGARWAGSKLELPESEPFETGQRLQLIEGLAEIRFMYGARVVVQGPAIFQIQDETRLKLSVGRIAATVQPGGSHFTVETGAAKLTTTGTEFGAEVEVDGGLAMQVYAGEVTIQPGGNASQTDMQLADGQGLRVEASTGVVTPLNQPNALQFVRYLPGHEMYFNLADVVAGGDGSGSGTRKAYRSGISLVDAVPVNEYGAPVQGDGRYHKAKSMDFVDGVFIPDARRGVVQVDSIGRLFAGFPETAGDCWGGAIMARRPKDEDSLPFIRLEFHGDVFGYVNWLHIASKPEELSPQGYGLIGMHSNCGITFDLHAIRARYPNKKLVRFRALIGNLESKPETHKADAWVIVDGQQRYRRLAFSREDGPEQIDVSLADHDRFLVLAVTDSGANTAYDWAAFGDPVIEMRDHREVSDAVARNCPSRVSDSQAGDFWPQEAGEVALNPTPQIATDANQHERSHLATTDDVIDSDGKVHDLPWRELEGEFVGGG